MGESKALSGALAESATMPKNNVGEGLAIEPCPLAKREEWQVTAIVLEPGQAESEAAENESAAGAVDEWEVAGAAVDGQSA